MFIPNIKPNIGRNVTKFQKASNEIVAISPSRARDKAKDLYGLASEIIGDLKTLKRAVTAYGEESGKNVSSMLSKIDDMISSMRSVRSKIEKIYDKTGGGYVSGDDSAGWVNSADRVDVNYRIDNIRSKLVDLVYGLKDFRDYEGCSGLAEKAIDIIGARSSYGIRGDLRDLKL
ncbi:MAG: hypothetical protein ABIH00_04145 [Armatimonadota bacterium]